MTSDARLLERLLEHHIKDENKSGATDLIKQSVKEYLLRLLNTREGSVLVDASYGMPSLNKHDMINDLSLLQLLKEKLKCYEPRLLDCELSIISNTQSQVFLSVLMKLNIKAASVYDEDAIHMELVGNFMADGTFCLDEEDALNYV